MFEVDIKKASQWYTPPAYDDHLPQGLLPWLVDQQSLTKRLRAFCHNRFYVRVLNQSFARPLWNERGILNMPDTMVGFIRHVQLWGNDKPLVFARTVIPCYAATGAMRRLFMLGNRPLGAALFADRSMRRNAVQIARLSPQQEMYAWAMAGNKTQPSELWARRSIFLLQQKPVLVNEIFLPDFMAML